MPTFGDTFDLGDGCADEKIIVQCWSEDTFSDHFIGECNIFFDSLKVGEGTKDGFTMLKETKSIGVVFIESHYQAPVPAEPEEEAPVQETPPEEAQAVSEVVAPV